jgi:hypothetical protein
VFLRQKQSRPIHDAHSQDVARMMPGGRNGGSELSLNLVVVVHSDRPNLHSDPTEAASSQESETTGSSKFLTLYCAHPSLVICQPIMMGRELA